MFWDFLANRYTATDLSRQYQISLRLHDMKQQPGQSIQEFYFDMVCLWDQLAESEPPWDCKSDAKKFTTHRDANRLIQFLMVLNDYFEPTRASILNQKPLPTLHDAIKILLSKETRRRIFVPRFTDTVLITHSSVKSSSSKSCNYCHKLGHFVMDCPTRVCLICQKKGPRHFPQHYPQNPDKSSGKSLFSHDAAITNSSPISDHDHLGFASSMVPLSEIESIIKQVLSKSVTSTALSMTSGTSWYFDSACCNHMTSDPTLFSTKQSHPNAPTIQTADGSCLHVS